MKPHGQYEKREKQTGLIIHLRKKQKKNEGIGAEMELNQGIVMVCVRNFQTD